MLISIVIPVYKSTGTLKELTQRIEEVFLKLSDLDYEIIFVNDSPFWEETKIVLRELLESPQRIVAVELTKNFGQHAATLCGFEIARGDYVLTMDDDLQHAPEDIPLLLEHASHDAVIAKFPDKQHSLFRRVMSRVKSEFERIILEKPAEIRLTAFRLLNISIAKKMLMRRTTYPFIPAMLFEVTGDVVNIDVNHYERKHGRSHYTLSRMIKLFSHLLINNSVLLLRFIGMLGLIIAIVSFSNAILISLRVVLYGSSIVGWPSTFTAILFFGGMILLTLGIIGEYLFRIVTASEQRPPFYVRTVEESQQ